MKKLKWNEKVEETPQGDFKIKKIPFNTPKITTPRQLEYCPKCKRETWPGRSHCIC